MTKCCSACFGDRGLTKNIIPTLMPSIGNCDYCGSTSVYCVNPSQLSDHFYMLKSVYREDENGQLLVDLMKNDWNLFTHPKMDTAYTKMLLSEIFDDGEIVRKNFSRSNIYQSTNLNSWETFRTELIQSNRYFPTQSLNEDKLSGLLSFLLADDLKTIWYRARVQTGDTPYCLDQMGPPPPRLATHGRANPPGIPYLYLGSSRDTAVSEIRPHIGNTVWVAEFKTVSELKVVDLRAPRTSVSPFLLSDAEAIGQLLADLPFLERLGAELTRPVLPQDAAIDYIPSQYICELIKKFGYNGVIYHSSVSDGYNMALFQANLVQSIALMAYAVDKIKIDIVDS